MRTTFPRIADNLARSEYVEMLQVPHLNSSPLGSGSFCIHLPVPKKPDASAFRLMGLDEDDTVSEALSSKDFFGL